MTIRDKTGKLRTSPETDTLLTPEEVAEQLRATENYLAQLRFRNRGPKFIRHDRLIRYRQSDVDAWLEAGTSATA